MVALAGRYSNHLNQVEKLVNSRNHSIRLRVDCTRL
jgi:hypothetical protein